MPIVAAFYKGTRAENPHARVFDRLVTWWPRSRGRFSHCELAVPRSGTVHACWSSSALDGGVRPKDIDMGTGRWVLVVIPGLEVVPALLWFEGAFGRFYDFPGILGYVVPFVKQVARWLYCSESLASAITAAARACNRPELAPPATHISPSGLFAWCAQLPGAEVIELSTGAQ